MWNSINKEWIEKQKEKEIKKGTPEEQELKQIQKLKKQKKRKHPDPNLGKSIK